MTDNEKEQRIQDNLKEIIRVCDEIYKEAFLAGIRAEKTSGAEGIRAPRIQDAGMKFCGHRIFLENEDLTLYPEAVKRFREFIREASFGGDAVQFVYVEKSEGKEAEIGY